ncbi:PspC domain-containing protein [Segeticoccus rhizosphaerae]|jgi:phage shock protein PspC (stress-responsive transcriptional regulator)|uniref:PspC domain-containing protein n=1 Tax=Segeticoccus rhizosphaerae TaxID=1104777 RepID=UPI00138FA501|nr:MULTISPECIES: PspC domain-containing protein [Intrasporangiaceae]
MNDDTQGRTSPSAGHTSADQTPDDPQDHSRGSDSAHADARSGLDKVFDSLRGLGVFRRSDDKWIGGVCSGVADRFGVDPIIVRAGFVLLGVLGGVGVTLYLLAWTLLPDDDGDIAAELALRDGDTSSIILSVVTALVLFSGFPWWWGHGILGWNFPWLLVVVAGLLWWFWSAARGGAPGSLAPEQQRARRERMAQRRQQAASRSQERSERAAARGQEWSAKAAARGQEWGDKAAASSQEWSEKVSAKSVERGQRRRAARRQARETRRPSGGIVLGLITIGLALVTYGTLEWIGPFAGVTGNWDAIALAAGLAVFGVVLVLAGLWGRRAGLVGFLAICMAFVTLGSAATPDNLRFGGTVGTERWAPSVVSGTPDYRILVGDGTVDLSRLPSQGLQDARVNASVGVGGLTVIVPDDLTVRVKAHVAAGEIKLPRGFVDDHGQSDTSNGLNVSRDVVLGDGPTEMVLDASVGTGQIRVDQDAR